MSAQRDLDERAGDRAPQPPANPVTFHPPYLLFTGDVTEPGYAKTAFGLRDWARDKCLAQWVLGDGSLDLGLPRMDADAAARAGARTVIVAVSNRGGFISDHWLPALARAAEAGLDIVSGMHMRLTSFPALIEAAERGGARLIDLRVPPADIAIGSGGKRSGQRLLTVGTDCALGKKYTALAVARALVERGVDADFRATGQTGIMIAGRGIPVDSVVVDFVAGAAEMLTPNAGPDHWDVIEGQGSLFHPAYAAVSLGLLHGSQPDGFLVCHHPGRRTVLGSPDRTLPTVERVIETTVALGRLTNSAIRCVGVAFNTSSYDADEAEALMARESERLGLPVADPMRGGIAFERLVDSCLQPSG